MPNPKLHKQHLDIHGLIELTTDYYDDHRGRFGRLFCVDELSSVLRHRSIQQINESVTVQNGAVRGLHYQTAHAAEMKIVRCLKGRVFDVAVDVRKGSPSFLKHVSIELTPQRGNAFVIPEGFAHGFQVLEGPATLLYLHTNSYQPGCEGAVRYDDPAMSIAWPLNARDLSQRDQAHPLIAETRFQGIEI